jgi:hypothetical protein
MFTLTSHVASSGLSNHLTVPGARIS